MIFVKAGDPIVLHTQLGSGNTGKYPVAIIRKADGSLFLPGPVALTDDGDGMYSDNSLTFPGGEPALIVTYIVYTDPGHTVVSEEDQAGTDIFVINDIELPEITDEIVAIIVDDGIYVGEFDDISEVSNYVEADEDITADVWTEPEIVLGCVEDEDLFTSELGVCT